MENSSLQHGEDVAAKNASAPRVTLDRMKSRVIGAYYFTGYDALKAAGYEAAKGVHFPSTIEALTICILMLDNGWTLLGKSAPASVENFDTDKGRHFAYEDALKQLWPLEGYLLREELWVMGEARKRGANLKHSAPVVKIQPHDDMVGYVGTKVINAKPMTRAIYCQLRGWDIPADENGNDPGYLVEYTDKLQDPPLVPGFRGYVSWSPADVFEATYSEFRSTARQDETERELDEPFTAAPDPSDPLRFDD